MVIEKDIENWKSLIYNGKKLERCEVSDLGRIRTIDTYVNDSLKGKRFVPGTVKKLRTNGIEKHLFFDYYYTLDGVRKHTSIYIHKAMYETFIKKIPKRKGKIYVSHKDDDVTNNKLNNLYLRSHSKLQKDNMFKYPQNRWRLAKLNQESGYNKVLEKETIKEIIYLYVKEKMKAETIAKKLNISLYRVYKHLKLEKVFISQKLKKNTKKKIYENKISKKQHGKVLKLFMVEEKSYKEIAEKLKIPKQLVYDYINKIKY